jgi:hypothetical protein
MLYLYGDFDFFHVVVKSSPGAPDDASGKVDCAVVHIFAIQIASVAKQVPESG